jgi:type II secretory pathway component PulK
VTTTAPSRLSRNAGFALPSVLFVVAMVTLVFLVAIEALASLAVETRGAIQRARFEAAASSAEADVAYQTATSPLAPRALITRGSGGPLEALALDGAPYALGPGLTASVQDEAGLINLDALPLAAKARLFAVMGVAPADRVAMADRLADYTDADDLRRANGAEADDYVRAGLPPPPNADLTRRAQVEGVMGWGRAVGVERWRAFADNVTADPSSVTSNVNTATEATLETLYGLAPERARAAIAQRARAPFTGVEALGRAAGVTLHSDAELVYTMPNGRFALKIEDAPAGLAYRSRVILSPADADRPFWIVEPAISSLTAAEKASPPVHALAFPDPAA